MGGFVTAAGIVVVALVVLAVLVLVVLAPARRLGRAVAGFRTTLDAGVRPLRGGLNPLRRRSE
jgi:Flp pilus assembly protein TadB